MRWITAVLAVAALFLVAGCGDTLSLDTRPRADHALPEGACGVILVPSQNPSDDQSVVRGTIPDLKWVNVHLAQEMLSSADFQNVVVEDGSNRDRAIRDERDWFVIDQFPEPGLMRAEDAGIVLSAMPYADEDCPPEISYSSPSPPQDH